MAALFPNGYPLFWQDLPDILFYIEFFKLLSVTHIFDLTAGHGSAAIAAVILGLKYDGITMSDQHMNFLDNLLDQAIFPIIADSDEDQTFAEEVSRYFAPLVDQGRRLVENEEAGEGEQQEEEEGEAELD